MQPKNQAPKTSVVEQLWTESDAMLRYALSTGLPVPPALVVTLASITDPAAADVRALASAHARLTELVAPAMPRMIPMLLTEPSDRLAWRRFGGIALVRTMMFVAIAALVGFVALSLSPDINDPQAGNIFASAGLPLLVNELFYLCAAAVGASFSGLTEAVRQVMRATYDVRYECVYWLRFLLGLIAGLLIATLFRSDIDAGSDAIETAHLTAAALALVGGFSSNLLYRVLTHLSDSGALLLTESADADAAERPPRAAARKSAPAAEDQRQLMANLLDLRRQLESAGSVGDARARIDALLGRMLDDLGEPLGSGPAAPVAGDAPETAAASQSEMAAGAPAAPVAGDAPETAAASQSQMAAGAPTSEPVRPMVQ